MDQIFLTDHALRRARQRGLSLNMIRFVFYHADRAIPVGSGCQSLSVSHARLNTFSKAELSPAERTRIGKTVLVVDEEHNTVVTVLRPQTGRGRRYRRRHASNDNQQRGAR